MIRIGPQPASGPESGAAAVEAAILLPLFLLLVFGVLEWALFMRDSLSVTDLAQVGVRTASAMPGEPGLTQTTVDSMARAGSGIPRDRIDFIYVYKANEQGYPGADGSTVMSCTGSESSCDRFEWNGTGFVLDPVTTPWNPQAPIGAPGHVNACSNTADGGAPDSVGVYVQASHDWVTQFFGANRKISDRAVQSFEPKNAAVCND